jgi:cell fate regulator YaaT (PSP1 superfamily)
MTTTPTHPEPKLKKGRPFGGKKKLFNIVPVQFRTSYVKQDADARELQLQPGDEVIVETSRGPTIAKVTGPVHRKVLPNDAVPPVLRKANDSDVRQAEKNEHLEVDAYRFGIERIRARKLPMKLIRAQYIHDGSKIVFYFSAEGRIDFRDLVKDLAHRFRTRIEMHQIGVRDGARMLGGIGPCGRELCCSTFLDNFEPVSIRMAKDQGLTLNPKKVSGMCGRLMCCLVYEQAVYRAMRTRLPRTGQRVSTEFGEATIIDVDVINRRASVQLADNNRRLLPVAEIRVLDPNRVDEQVDDDAEIEDGDYLWDDVKPERRSDKDKLASDDGQERSKRRRSRRGEKKDGEARATAASQENKARPQTREAQTREASPSEPKKQDPRAQEERKEPTPKPQEGASSEPSSSKSSRSRRRRNRRRASGSSNKPRPVEDKS